MSDVQLASASTVSKVPGLSQGCSSHGNEPPAFILPPRNARVTLGGNARLEGKVCGHPEPQVTWYREGRAVVGGERFVVERGGRGNFSLLVSGVAQEDLGRYTCQATNQAGSRQVTVEILLEENSGKKYVVPSSMKTGCRSAAPSLENRPSIWSESPPKFINKPSRVFVEPGRTAKFSVKTTGRPQPRVTWYKGEAELQSGGRVSVFERSGLHFLEIKEVRVEDAGSYTCSISNSAGMATASAELTIQGVPDDSSGTVGPSEDPQTRTRSLKEDRAAPSAPSSRPEPPRPREKQQQLRQAQSKPPVLPLLAERRTAAAQARSIMGPDPAPGSDSSRAVIKSTSGSNLRFEAIPLDQEATEGAQVTFTCQASSSAAGAALTWLRDGDPVRTGPGLRQRRDGTRLSLTLERVRRADRGTYRCQLTTADGLTVESAAWTLRVHSASRPPAFISLLQGCSVSEGQTISLQACVEGKPAPSVRWLLHAASGRSLFPLCGFKL